MSKRRHFPVRLRAAAVIPRWSIVWTAKPDSVAQHSFFHAIYCNTIADIIGWDGDRARLLQASLYHDLDELVTGDIVAPVKRHIIDRDKLKRFVRKTLAKIAPSVLHYHGIASIDTDDYREIRAIMKVADALDALFYALTEQAQGNKVIEARVPVCRDALRSAWMKLPYVQTSLNVWWADVIEPAIREHSDPRYYDIDEPQDDLYDPYADEGFLGQD